MDLNSMSKLKYKNNQWRIYIVNFWMHASLSVQCSLFGEIWPNNRLVPLTAATALTRPYKVYLWWGGGITSSQTATGVVA